MDVAIWDKKRIGTAETLCEMNVSHGNEQKKKLV
jgi:hypothetical protein